MRTLILSVAFIVGAASIADAARLKDVANIRGIRANELLGFGLVVGLNGTGDDEQALFTPSAIQQLLRRFGSKVRISDIRVRNVAGVIVTARLPPFARVGTRINVTISSLGNAKSLQGGVLLLTPLKGVDGRVYAVSQGSLTIGGFTASGKTGSSVTKNHTTVGRIAQGATVEREVPSTFVHDKRIVVTLRRPDPTTAARTAIAIDKALSGKHARALDPATIAVTVPKRFADRSLELVAALEGVNVQPDRPAQVVIDPRTGTVIVGQHVSLTPVAIAHGGLTVKVTERLRVSQPKAAFSRSGRTRVVPDSKVEVTEEPGSLHMIKQAPSLADVVQALNALGVNPRNLVTILQALEAEGSLAAKLIIL